MRSTFFMLFLLAIVACDTSNKQENANSQAGTNTSSSTSAEQPKSNDPFLIDPNQGFGQIIANKANLQDLQAIYGAESVVAKEISLGEGDMAPGIVIFPDTDNEVEIFAGDPRRPRMARFARVSREGGKWHTADGIRVGSSLASLRRVNNHNIQFYGFGWDYGGTIINWGSGTYGNTKLMARLAPAASLDVPELVGDHMIKADMFIDHHNQIFVSELSIIF